MTSICRFVIIVAGDLTTVIVEETKIAKVTVEMTFNGLNVFVLSRGCHTASVITVCLDTFSRKFKVNSRIIMGVLIIFRKIQMVQLF